MSLVVVNATGPTTTTLPLISSLPGRTITIKDSGSASGTNTVTIVATAGNTFETGVASYILNTPLAFITFLGNPTTLKWRVIATTYADVPITIAAVAPATGTLGGAAGTLTTLSVSGLTTLGNSSNTGNLGVAGTTTLNSVSATNINFTGTLSSNGTTFSGAPAGINSAGSVGIGAAAGATTLLVTGTQSNTGTLGVAGATTLGSVGIGGAPGATTLLVTGTQSNTGTLGVAGDVTMSGNLSATGSIRTSGLSFSNGNSGATYNFTTFNSGVGYTRMTLTASTNGLGAYYLGINCNAPTEFLDVNGNAKVAGNITTTGGISSRSFTTITNINDTVNNAPSYGMGVTSNFAGLSTYGSAATQPIQIAGYYGINFLGGTALWGANASHMCIVDGKVGILNRNPQQPLDVNGRGIFRQSLSLPVLGGYWGINSLDDDAARFGFYSNGNTLFNTWGGTLFSFCWNGAANAWIGNGSNYIPSDIRIKKNIKASEIDSLGIINKLNFVSFDYRDESRGSVDYGLIAQELKEVYPSGVSAIRGLLPTHLAAVDIDIDASANTVLIKCQNPHGLVVNDEIKLDIDDTFIYKTVLEVPSETSFVVQGSEKILDTSSVSIYGKYVDDLLGINDTQIGILAAGACQTLSGQVSTLQADASNASTITGQQASTIRGLEATIAAILQKYPL